MFAVVSVFGAAAMVSVMMTMSLTSDRRATLELDQARAQYLAEGAVEVAKNQAQLAVANWQEVPTTGTAYVNGVEVPYSITPTGFNSAVADGAGVQTIVTGYNIQGQGSSGTANAQANRIINTLATPIFQFAVFYDNDLEMLPGPDMTLRGRVHSNSNMYLGSNSTMTIDSNYLHAIGKIYRCRKNDPSASEGTVRVRRWVNNPFSGAEPTAFSVLYSKPQMSGYGISTTSGYDSDFTAGYDLNHDGDMTDIGDYLPFLDGATSYWSPPTGYSGPVPSGGASTVMTGEHGISEASVPQLGSTAMYEPSSGGNYSWDAALGEYKQVAAGTGTHNKGYFHGNAGLSLIAKADGTWKAYNAAGTDISSSVSAAVSVKQMYNTREAGGTTTKVKLVEIDVAKLTASGKFPANGLIYCSNYGQGTGTNSGGFRLTNGATLPGKMTLVSNGPVYVKGDFNTSAKKGAAIIADAINLLSNSWNDSKTKGTLPAATNTTYNFAMIAGNTETKINNYNGGLENLPRFHENWSGKTCTYSGSLVNLWYSQYAKGKWSIGGDYYQAPNRNWTYDTAFNTVANLPPFTPMIVQSEDVVSW